jgi:thiol-disulfide isomerase/thioredoxin
MGHSNINHQPSHNYFDHSPFVQELSPKDFDPIATWKLNDSECSMVLFYADWCPFCKKIKEEWEKLGKLAGFCSICAFNCEKYQSHFMKIKEDMPKLIISFPTIIVYKNGDPIELVGKNEEDRTAQKLLKICMRLCQSSKGR